MLALLNDLKDSLISVKPKIYKVYGKKKMKCNIRGHME